MINSMADDDEIPPEDVNVLLKEYVGLHIEDWEWLRITIVLNKWIANLNYVDVDDVENLLDAFTTDSDETQSDFKFEMHEEDYENGVQYLSIFDKGSARFEIRVWNDILDHEAFLKAKAAEVDDDQLYKMIVHYTTLEKTATSWKEIRQR